MPGEPLFFRTLDLRALVFVPFEFLVVHKSTTKDTKSTKKTQDGCSYACGTSAICMASTGQTKTQSVQSMQSSGRGSQGVAPAISRQSAGQTTTQSPQPVQRAPSSFGS